MNENPYASPLSGKDAARELRVIENTAVIRWIRWFHGGATLLIGGLLITGLISVMPLLGDHAMLALNFIWLAMFTGRNLLMAVDPHRKLKQLLRKIPGEMPRIGGYVKRESRGNRRRGWLILTPQAMEYRSEAGVFDSRELSRVKLAEVASVEATEGRLTVHLQGGERQVFLADRAGEWAAAFAEMKMSQ